MKAIQSIFCANYFLLFGFVLFGGHAQAKPFAENPVKRSIENSATPTLGGYVSIVDAKVVENLALPGKLKFIWIEALQNDLGPKEVQQLVIACENEEIVPIVRVPNNDPEEIKKYLGTGVLGVIIPHIHNKEEAEKAVAATKYPPEGTRPAGVERANRYMGRLKEYMASANQNILVIFTLDNKEMLQNIDSILSVKGIDVLHIGPLHLSSSMGVAIDSPELKQAIEKVEAIARKRKIPLGGALADYKKMEDFQRRGYRFLTIPADFELLRDGVSEFFTRH